MKGRRIFLVDREIPPGGVRSLGVLELVVRVFGAGCSGQGLALLLLLLLVLVPRGRVLRANLVGWVARTCPGYGRASGTPCQAIYP